MENKGRGKKSGPFRTPWPIQQGQEGPSSVSRYLQLLDTGGRPTSFQVGDVITWDEQWQSFTFSRRGTPGPGLTINGDLKFRVPGLKDPTAVVELLLLGRNLVYSLESSMQYKIYTLTLLQASSD